ncbi:hypothetical protein GCM10022219_11620 [Microbacterium oryzae]|uniref:Uncharacterized protein n=1 Tax=Microbacterium oryzae TaxID=743009 RepID=A0A6I6EBQ3_9MICO|nr:hypothetical protein [Microbacterium oryzae]QGU28468.1 hypothetical protein D7D94_12900 [Microbacterium oryzae]
MTDDHFAFRDKLAAERGISDEDRDLLLTGTDETTLLAQADYLEPPRDLTKGNVARREGQYVSPGSSSEQRFATYVNELFNEPSHPLDTFD